MLIDTLFYGYVLIFYIYITLLAWSILFPDKRVWPPPRRRSWQYVVFWGLFYVAVALGLAMIALDWNKWIIPFEIRIWVGAPLVALGGLFVTWAIFTLGLKNTEGLQEGFVEHGPYRFTRNPQYLGDMVMFFGLILFANSLYAAVIFPLAIIVFAIMPFPEEMWLEKQYGEIYMRYKIKTPRFL
ncbi:MAG: hypothetical protein GXP42_06760 [Chloroflexi bacterium]|nr:hypothetical protein [Chloroflexota bacterium]